MSAAASPGRTWFIFLAERRVPVLARAPAAAFLHGGCCVARLPGLGGPPSPAFFAHLGDQNDSCRQPGVERHGHRRLDRDIDSVPVKDVF